MQKEKSAAQNVVAQIYRQFLILMEKVQVSGNYVFVVF
nr:MAG TPA: hypothetical protein [Caudoviricetes sp.]